MQHPYDDEQSIPYQPEQGQVATHDQNASNAPTMPTIPASPPHNYATEYPDYSQQPPLDQTGGYPSYPQQPPRRSSGGVRAGAIFLLTLLLAVVFGVGLFSGWQYGRSGSVATAPTTGQLQSGTTPSATIPPYTPSNTEQVREAVIAKVSPSVVQINVTLANGSAIGSGVIIDKRGYIVTNNHVVDGAQSVDVVLFDGTKISAQVVGTDPTDDLAVLKINPPASNLAVATLVFLKATGRTGCTCRW